MSQVRAPASEAAKEGTRMTDKSTSPLSKIDDQTQLELEAAAFRRLVSHFRERTDVQNIDLMNLAGFCRNCLSNWYKDAADAKGLDLSKDAAREIVYGMPYAEWREKYQTEATPEQQAKFSESHKHHG
jgi:hypothetical protein